MVKKWFITGGCGFIGTSLISRILSETPDAAIVVFDNLSTGGTAELEEIAPFQERKPQDVNYNPGVILVKGDIKSFNDVNNAMKGTECTVHLAANTGVQPSVKNPRLDMENNVIGTFNAIEAARCANISKFIFASSGAPAGVASPPIHEEIAPHPVSPYGASKLAGEGYCSSYYHTFNLNTIALRFSNVYGPRSKLKSSVVAKFIGQALIGKSNSIYGSGNQTRDFIYIDDLIEAMFIAANTPIGGEIFQIASGKELTVNEVAQVITKQIKLLTGKDISFNYEAPLKGDVLRNYSDTSKAKKILNWEAKTFFEDGIANTILYFLHESSRQI